MNKRFLVKAKATIDISFERYYAEECDANHLARNFRKDCEDEALKIAEKLGSLDIIKEYGIEQITEYVYEGTGESNDPSISEIRNDILNKLPYLQLGDKCPHCKKGRLIFINEAFPYATNHLQCDKCDSTFNLEDEYYV